MNIFFFVFCFCFTSIAHSTSVYLSPDGHDSGSMCDTVRDTALSMMCCCLNQRRHHQLEATHRDIVPPTLVAPDCWRVPTTSAHC
jgi:hypothetical protein